MEPVSVRTRFERFPATVKGALVFRGEDRDPHQIAVRSARVVGLRGGSERDVPVERAIVTVPPHQDLFVPFEMAVADLDPGWYGFEVEVDLDGAPRTLYGDRRFSVPWPRGTMRTGIMKADRSFRVGAIRVVVTRVQLASDATTLRLELDPPAPVECMLSAEPGGDLPVVETELDERSGTLMVRAYPVPRDGRKLRLEIAGGEDRGTVELSLG
ncbi:MAG: hypothetical protein ACJ77A_12705 [Actinomycetota bacterium]